MSKTIKELAEEFSVSKQAIRKKTRSKIQSKLRANRYQERGANLSCHRPWIFLVKTTF